VFEILIRMRTNTVHLKQINDQISKFRILNEEKIPSLGWIKALRTGLNMTLEQLGNKLNISKQAVLDIEKRELKGALSLKSLNEIADAMEMELVYCFVPKNDSLESLIDKKAMELATKIVMRTSQQMKLEGQENSEERIQIAIKERAHLIKTQMPKMLWD
jgi:predicted DNA-binding mobile mystery protein A